MEFLPSKQRSLSSCVIKQIETVWSYKYIKKTELLKIINKIHALQKSRKNQ